MQPNTWLRTFGTSLEETRRSPDLHARIATEVRQGVAGKSEHTLRTIIKTVSPVPPMGILFMACHMAAHPEDVPSAVMGASSQRGHAMQMENSAFVNFTDFISSPSGTAFRSVHEVGVFTIPMICAEDVVSDINQVGDGEIYLVENPQGTVICAVVYLQNAHYYHLYPHADGILMAGPCNAIAVCDSIISHYPQSFAGCDRLLIQKKVLVQ